MKKIPSFTIDHLHLLRGIYVSRKDYIGNNVVTTFDIRMKEPNREPAIGYGALHTIEHLAATYLRNHPVYGNKIVFWGPMGCCTGNYFLMQGDLSSENIIDLMKETFRFIRDYKTAGTTCCTTCLWPDTKPTNIYEKYWKSSPKKIYITLPSNRNRYDRRKETKQ